MSYSKAERKEILGALSGITLYHSQFAPAVRVRAHIRSDPRAAVLYGLSQRHGLLVDRAGGYGRAWRHFEARPELYAEATPEMVERFRGLEAEALREAGKIRALAEKVSREGFGEELEDQDLPGHPDFSWRR